MSKTTTGVIRRVVGEKGFGFIRTDSGLDYFFHRSEVLPPLQFGPVAPRQSRLPIASYSLVRSRHAPASKRVMRVRRSRAS